MDESKISVIIPIYNVEPYLEKCVNSVCAQTYGNLEIILVDDGSPDNCPALCDCLAQRDPRLRVIHKENGGVSSARNAGLDIATGDYIGFVDGDDYIEPDMYRQLLAALEENQADIALCGFKRVDEEGKILSAASISELKCLSGNEMLMLTGYERVKKHPIDLGLHDAFMPSWNKLYRRKAIKTVRFDETVSVGEDGLFFTCVLLGCENIKAVIRKETPYFYLMRRNSACHVDTLHNWKDSRQSTLKIIRAMEPIIQTQSELKKAPLSRLLRDTFAYIRCVAAEHGAETLYWDARADIVSRMPMIKEELATYSRKYQISLLLLYRFPRCFWLLARLRWGRAKA